MSLPYFTLAGLPVEEDVRLASKHGGQLDLPHDAVVELEPGPGGGVVVVAGVVAAARRAVVTHLRRQLEDKLWRQLEDKL